MAIEYAEPGKVIDVRPFAGKLARARTKTLAKTDRFELVRLVVHAGREIAAPAAPGELIVQCLEGEVALTTLGTTRTMRPGELLYIPSHAAHSIKATSESSLLVTIVSRMGK